MSYTRTERTEESYTNYRRPRTYNTYNTNNAYSNNNNEEREQRKPGHRRTIDYTGLVARWTHKRITRPSMTDPGVIRPHKEYIIDLFPPFAYSSPMTSVTPKFVHSSVNKMRHPVNLVRWTPEGRRLLGASSSGEFTLWNGTTFNFETLMQAHDQAVRTGQWSHNDDWFLSGDQEGLVKYWLPNMNNVKVLAAHREAVRDLSFSPTDTKFVTASDDSTLKIWNFNEGIEERTLTGHGWDVKCVHWHPSKGLIVSGSKDNLVKLWDPRTANCLTTLHGHKNTITRAEFQPTHGNWLATSARDQTTRVFDIRAMKELAILRGAECDMTTLAWHPIHASLLATGDFNGAVNFYLLDSLKTVEDSALSLAPVHSIPFAHESAIWSMEFHPLGHILCTGSNDKFTRFWCRGRPGDEEQFSDQYYVGHDTARS